MTNNFSIYRLGLKKNGATKSASASHAGSNPSYQWQINGTNVGSNSPIFSSASLAQGDQVSVILTSSETCVNQATVSSNTIVVQVNPLLSPSVNISADASTYCQGQIATFSASSTHGGLNPSYQWKVNGVNVGTNSAIYSASNLSNGDLVSVELSSSENCLSQATVLSNTITAVIHPLVSPSVSISANAGSYCAGQTATFTASPVNGGSNPTYQWKVNGQNVGSNSPNYSSNSLNQGDAVSLSMTSSESCVSTTSALSNTINVTINPLLSPSVSISANANSYCAGQAATFTSTVNNGGTNPSYQWKVNGLNVGTNSPSFTSSTLSNNDIVSLEITSNESCLTSTNALSNNLSVQINPVLVPLVNISTTNTSFCAGETVLFTSTVSNAGNNPGYQWKVNGVNVGTNSPSFSSTTLSNNDVVSLAVLGSGPCASSSPGLSNNVSLSVKPLAQINPLTPPTAPLCPQDSLVLTATVASNGFAGSLSAWQGPGVLNNVFYASLAGPGSHYLRISFMYTDAPYCSVSDSILVSVSNLPKPTLSRNGLVLSCNESGYNYLWHLNGLPAPGTNNQQNYTVSANGNYHVEMSDGSCSDTSATARVIDLSFDELKAYAQWQLFPNPSRDKVQLRLQNPGLGEFTIRIYDSRGALLKEINPKASGKILEAEIRISDWAVGIYHIHVQAGSLEIWDHFSKQ